MQWNNAYYTRLGEESLDRFPCSAKHQKEATKWNWVTLTTLCKEITRKMSARWSYPETMKLDSIMKKKHSKLESELQAESFRVSERPKEMDSNPDHQQKTSIMSRHPKRTGMRSGFARDVCKKLGETACTSKENWNEPQETCERGQAIGGSCLHSQRELKWSSRELYGVEEELKFEDDPSSSTLCS